VDSGDLTAADKKLKDDIECDVGDAVTEMTNC